MFSKAGSNNVGCVESQESSHCLSIWIPSYGPRLTLHRLGVGVAAKLISIKQYNNVLLSLLFILDTVDSLCILAGPQSDSHDCHSFQNLCVQHAIE